MRRRAAWAAAAIVPTLIAANYMPRLVLYIFAGILVLSLMVIGCFRYRGKMKKTFFLLVSAVIALSSFMVQYEICDHPIALFETQRISARVVFLENDSGNWLIKVESASCKRESFRLYGQTHIAVYDAQISPYDIADVQFVLQRAEANSSDSFAAEDVKILNVHIPDRKGIMQRFSEFRESVITCLQVRIGGEEGLLAASFLTGASDNLPSDVRLNFSRTGLSHIMAVSGLHLSVLSGIIVYLLSKIKTHCTLLSIITLLFVGFVVVLGGFSTSVLRAAIMSAIMLIGFIGYRKADPINSLGVALIAIGLIFPFRVVKPAYLLTAAATLGILLLSPIIEDMIIGRTVLSRKHKKQWAAVCVSISCAVATAPVLVFYFGELSLLSVPAMSMSIINYPAVFVLVASAIFCCVYWIPFLGDFIGFLVRLVARLVLDVVDLLADLDMSTISVRGWPMILLFIFAFIGIIVWIIWRDRIKLRRCIAGVTAVLVTVSAILVVMYPHTFSRLTVLKSGNFSSGIYINHGQVIVVDCGNRYLASLVRDEVGRNGLDQMDALIITDIDDAVSGGVSALLSYMPAKTVILPKGNLHQDAYREIMEAAQGSGAKILTMSRDFDFALHDIQLHGYVDRAHENRFILTLCDGEYSAAFFSSLNEATIHKCLQYPIGEFYVDSLVVGVQSRQGSISSKLLYITKPSHIFASTGSREITAMERRDAQVMNADLYELGEVEYKVTYYCRKEKIWIYRNSNNK